WSRDHFSGGEVLKASCSVGNICAADVLREQFAVRTHVGREADVWLDVSDTGNIGDVFNARVVENTSGISLCALAFVSSFAFVSGARRTIESGKITEATTEDDNLVEEVERFEAREHVALHSETERHHRDYLCHP